METKTVYFEKPGQENTDETLRIAKKRADELGIKTVVVATTLGGTGVKAVDVFKGLKVIVVSHSVGFHDPNVSELTEENKNIIESKGGKIVTATHVFAGIGRAIRLKFGTNLFNEIIANTLRIFGEGMKVVPEIAMMAADAGAVRTDEDAVVITGTHRGADTAVVLTPVYSQQFFSLEINEILCKTRLKNASLTTMPPRSA